MSEQIEIVTLIPWLVLTAMSSHTASINPKFYSVYILRLSKGYDNIVKSETKITRQR